MGFVLLTSFVPPFCNKRNSSDQYCCDPSVQAAFTPQLGVFIWGFGDFLEVYYKRFTASGVLFRQQTALGVGEMKEIRGGKVQLEQKCAAHCSKTLMSHVFIKDQGTICQKEAHVIF